MAPQNQPQQIQQVLAHNQVLGAPIIVHGGNSLDDGRYLIQTNPPIEKKPMVFAVVAQKVEVQQLNNGIHLIKMYQ